MAILNKLFKTRFGDLRKAPGGGSEFRLPVLVYGTLSANERNRFWQSQKTIANDLGTYKPRISDAIDWLIEMKALEIVPHELRVGMEKQVRGHVYQLTGAILLDGEKVPYLYLGESNVTESVPEKGTESVTPKKPKGTDSDAKGTLSDSTGTDSEGIGTDSASVPYYISDSVSSSVVSDSSSSDAPAPEAPPSPEPATPDDDEEMVSIFTEFQSVSGKAPTDEERRILRELRANYGSANVLEALGKARGQGDIKHYVKWVKKVLENDYRKLGEQRDTVNLSDLLRNNGSGARDDLPQPEPNPVIDAAIAKLGAVGLTVAQHCIERSNGGFVIRIPSSDYDTAEGIGGNVSARFLKMDDHILTYEIIFSGDDETTEASQEATAS